MRGSLLKIAAGLALALAVAGCSSATQVSTSEVHLVVVRDGIAFSGEVIPDRVIDRLAPNRVVVIGETHHLREHYALVAGLLRSLHGRGFRQLLVEWPQMADWLLNDYVGDGALLSGWVPPVSLGGPMFDAIRDFNATLPPDDRIQVRAIDVNLEDYGGATSFRNLLGALASQLPSAGPIAAFLQAAYGTPAAQTSAIDSLRSALEAGETSLVASWGTARYRTVLEMVEIEQRSIGIRAERDARYESSTRAREDVIKLLADRRIAGSPHRTVINVGGTHAQKARLFGTDLEWLGDYLVHRSPATEGSVFVVGVASARTELEQGSTGTPYDVRATSPENELFRRMVEGWPGRTVFLPLDDPMFTDGGVPVNFEETIYVTALRRHYDAVLQYALAHRVPID